MRWTTMLAFSVAVASAACSDSATHEATVTSTTDAGAEGPIRVPAVGSGTDGGARADGGTTSDGGGGTTGGDASVDGDAGAADDGGTAAKPDAASTPAPGSWVDAKGFGVGVVEQDGKLYYVDAGSPFLWLLDQTNWTYGPTPVSNPVYYVAPDGCAGDAYVATTGVGANVVFVLDPQDKNRVLTDAAQQVSFTAGSISTYGTCVSGRADAESGAFVTLASTESTAPPLVPARWWTPPLTKK